MKLAYTKEEKPFPLVRVIGVNTTVTVKCMYMRDYRPENIEEVKTILSGIISIVIDFEMRFESDVSRYPR